MKEEKSPRSTAALTMFLLFAAVLFGLTPAEASIPRAGVAEDGPPLLALHELAPSAIAPSRFGFVQSVWLLDVESAPGCFGLFGLETRRCERTYARNNPLKYVDRDGKNPALAVAAAPAAADLTYVGGVVAGTVIAGMLVQMAVERFGPGMSNRFAYEYGALGSDPQAVPGLQENLVPLERRRKDKDSADEPDGGHESGQRPSTKEKHEKGDERRRRDQGGEKKDPRMPYRRKGWVPPDRDTRDQDCGNDPGQCHPRETFRMPERVNDGR